VKTLATGRRLGRRLLNLYLGLVLFGASCGMIVASGLGLGPWDVFHQGVSRRIGISLGWVVVGVSFLVLLFWIPLRQRPGLGTISNAVLVGIMIDVTLSFLNQPETLAGQVGLLVGGVVGTGIGTGLYIGAGLGPGPRDGLMTGLAARGHSIRVVRTVLELSVLALGWWLGGTVGVGTLVFALAIGPLAHIFIPLLTVEIPAGVDGEAR
jgi:uncharacterized membrane protein YczE